ncbi:MAG: OmpA family protein [Sulfurospirillaceae bacterium]|nr:OmpA family protein [Sulfurospirillaceae bacterium]MDD3462845.1 OmpA family protein [Sulfurospirillaceae bacterium]
MNYAQAILLSLLFMVFGGCATSSRVVLLEGNKENSAVIVKTQGGEEVLEKPNSYTELSSPTSKPTQQKSFSMDEINKQFGTLIKGTPKPPTRFLLYFHSGGTTLTAESLSLFEKIEQAIKDRAPCVVNIIGHADREGSSKSNIAISLSRAKSVHELLVKKNLDIVNITVESYGEEDPLIQTEDEVSEPRNRRVELLIR